MHAVLVALSLLTSPDLSALSGRQREAFMAIASEEFCHCQSPLTIAGCLDLRPNCKMASHLGELIVRGLSTGSSKDEMLAFLSRQVLGPFCAAQKGIELPGAPSRGPERAKLTLVEFADFRCGHCKKAAPVIKQALKRYGSQVKFVFAPFPLGNNPLSVAAAEAALAAGAQGKFWEMQEALFAYDGELDQPALEKLAQKLGLDAKRFKQDLDAHTFRDKVLAWKQKGVDAGVQGTPAFFINGRPFEPDSELFGFEARFDMELDRNLGSCQ